MKLPNFFESILLAELNLGVRPTSFFQIAEDWAKRKDDWTLVLQLHAYLEGGLNVLLLKRRSQLTEPFDDRITFARKVDLAFRLEEFSRDTQYKTFFSAINSLRNRFAHDPRYIKTDLKCYLDHLSPRERVKMLDALGVCHQFEMKTGEGVISRAEVTLEFPQISAWLSSAYALELLSLSCWIEIGEDGKPYADDFRPTLQDLLNDPKVKDFIQTISKSLERLVS
jgi:hypothetical protein